MSPTTLRALLPFLRAEAFIEDLKLERAVKTADLKTQLTSCINHGCEDLDRLSVLGGVLRQSAYFLAFSDEVPTNTRRRGFFAALMFLESFPTAPEERGALPLFVCAAVRGCDQGELDQVLDCARAIAAVDLPTDEVHWKELAMSMLHAGAAVMSIEKLRTTLAGPIVSADNIARDPNGTNWRRHEIADHVLERTAALASWLRSELLKGSGG